MPCARRSNTASSTSCQCPWSSTSTLTVALERSLPRIRTRPLKTRTLSSRGPSTIYSRVTRLLFVISATSLGAVAAHEALHRAPAAIASARPAHLFSHDVIDIAADDAGKLLHVPVVRGNAVPAGQTIDDVLQFLRESKRH